MSVESFFESERRKKQIRGLLVILALCFVGTMISSHFSNSKKPAPVPQTTSSTQISMVPSKADYEQHQAIYNDRLLNLEREQEIYMHCMLQQDLIPKKTVFIFSHMFLLMLNVNGSLIALRIWAN